FLAAGRLSSLVQAERRSFLLELGKLLSPQGWLSISTLKLEGRTVAWNYGFKFGGSWFWYQPAFDGEFAHLSPRSYLLCEILRSASNGHEIHTVDLGLGDEEYKQRFANGGRQTLHVTASSRTRKVFEVCRYRAGQWVKRYPQLEHAARAYMTKVQSVRRVVATDGLRNRFASRAMRLLGSASEVLFFECTTSQPSREDLSLRRLSFKLLATAAKKYEEDKQTLDYILRASSRLKSAGSEGLALTNSEDIPVHFCWVSPFEGFK